MRPQRIILIRHGESEGNVDKNIYEQKPDYALELTERGMQQAKEAGKKLREMIGDEKTAFFVSPFWRTRMTFENIASELKKENIIYKEDPRLREQEWGHLRTVDDTNEVTKERDKFGIFYFRFNHGESGADVYDRISDFLSTLMRDFEKNDFPNNVVIVTHGLTMRLFIMRWFHLTVEQFEEMKNPDNCGMYILKLVSNNKYELETPYEKHNVFHLYQRPVKF